MVFILSVDDIFIIWKCLSHLRMGNWISKHCWSVLGTFSGKMRQKCKVTNYWTWWSTRSWIILSFVIFTKSIIEWKKLYTHTYFKLSNTAFNSGVTLQVRILSPMCSQSSVKSLGRGRGRSCNSVKPSTKEFRKDLLICRLWFEKGKKGRWNNKTCSLGGKCNSLFIRKK